MPAHLRRRRLQLYGVGQGKSGTTTLARMFREYRFAHEIDTERFVPIVVGVVDGEYGPDARRVRFELRRRSIRFRLEVDSAAFLSPFAGVLASIFPDARFVLTLRDCFSWVDSRVEWDHKIPLRDTPVFAPLRVALHRPYPTDFAPEEAPLRDAGLWPVASYLRIWAQQNESVLRQVPSERLLVLRTEDLDQASDLLARFAGVPEGTVHASRANTNPQRVGLLAGVPRGFIVERAQEHCGVLMEQYWGPGWCELQTRLPNPTSTR